MPIDLNADARRGQPFALPWEAGGTARVDGRAYGVIVRARVSDPGGSLFDGDVVRLRTNGGSFPDVQPSATLEEPVFGVVVDPTFQGVANGLMCDVLVVGFHPHVKISGSANQYDYLKASGSPAAALAVSDPRTPNIFGRTTGPSSGGYVAATILSQPLYVGAHSQLGGGVGLRRHSNVVESAAIALNGMSVTGAGSAGEALTDESDATYLGESFDPVWMDLDLGRPLSVTALFMRWSNSGGGDVLIQGSTDAAFTAPVTVFSETGLITPSTPATKVETWRRWTPSAPFRYYRIKVSGVGGGVFTLYRLGLHEAAGQAVLVDGGYDLDTILSQLPAPSWPPDVITNTTDPSGNELILTGTAETILPGCDLTLTPAGAVRATLDIWASQADGGHSKELTFRLRRDGLAGEVLATKVFGDAGDSSTGHQWEWADEIIDSRPTTGRYVLTVQATDGSGTGQVWSDTRTFGLSTLAQISPSGSPLTTKGDILGHTTVDARIPVGADHKILAADSSQAAGVKYVGNTRSFGVDFDGGTDDLIAGKVQDVVLPAAGTITGWALVGDGVGSCSIHVWRAPLGSFPPTSADSITAGNDPTLSAADHASDTTLTGWTKDFHAGDVVRFTLNTSSGLKKLTLTITYEVT